MPTHLHLDVVDHRNRLVGFVVGFALNEVQLLATNRQRFRKQQRLGKRRPLDPPPRAAAPWRRVRR